MGRNGAGVIAWLAAQFSAMSPDLARILVVAVIAITASGALMDRHRAIAVWATTRVTATSAAPIVLHLTVQKEKIARHFRGPYPATGSNRPS